MNGVLARLREWIFPSACAGCDRPGWALCAECAPTECDAIAFSVAGIEAFALAAYDGPVRAAVVAMKHGERDPIAAFAHLVEPSWVLGTLVPVPTTRARAAERGFDQSVAIVRRVAEIHDVPWAHVLEKYGRSQAGRGRRDRLEASGRFRIRRDAVLPPLVTVFDDVCTTGATLNDAIATLRRAGVEVGRILVLARTPADSRAGEDAGGTRGVSGGSIRAQ
jgi:predicted amidophosphoribosyltransferase